LRPWPQRVVLPPFLSGPRRAAVRRHNGPLPLCHPGGAGDPLPPFFTAHRSDPKPTFFSGGFGCRLFRRNKIHGELWMCLSSRTSYGIAAKKITQPRKDEERMKRSWEMSLSSHHRTFPESLAMILSRIFMQYIDPGRSSLSPAVSGNPGNDGPSRGYPAPPPRGPPRGLSDPSFVPLFLA